MQITLEGHDQPVPVQAGDTLLGALLRAGGMLLACRTQVWSDIVIRL